MVPMVRVLATPGVRRTGSWFELRQYSRGNPQNSQIMPRLRPLLALLPLLSATGCCSLARLFCGPDDSAWVQIDYDTPAATMRTFLEALRRDNVDRLVLCLDDDYKQANGIDRLVAQVAWEEVRKQNPYLYMAGYAKVPDQPTSQQLDLATYDLRIEGYQLHFELRRRFFWLVNYLDAHGEMHEKSMAMASLAPYLRLADPDRQPAAYDEGYAVIEFLSPGAWQLAPNFPFGADDPDLRQIVRVEFGQEWKITDLPRSQPD